MPKNKLPPARDYLENVARSNDVLSALAEPDTTTRRAFGKAALKISEQRSQGLQYLDTDTQVYRLIGLFDGYVDAESFLNMSSEDGETKHGSRAERVAHKLKAIEFNHAIKELIDTHPELTTNDVVTFFKDLSIQFPDPKRTQDLLGYLRIAITGMQQEIVAEQALWSIDEVENVIQASAEEELRGIDLKVIYKGETVYLDIKSSSMYEQKAIKDRGENAKSLPIWTGLYSHDFEGKFRANNEQVAIVAERLQRALDNQILLKSTG